MRAGLVVIALLCGCTCGGESSAPPSSAPPTTLAPSPPTTLPIAPMEPPAPTLTAEQMRENAGWLHEARRATAAHDYTTALERFDRILARSPNAPRLQCESGYVAHLAGNDEEAARRLDLGLRLFGPDARLEASDRVPVARCTFNRGIVYQAAGATDAARALYERSITLRPNDIVSARLASLGEAAAPTSEPSEHTIEGVSVRASDDLVLVRTHDAAVLDRVVTAWVLGLDAAEQDDLAGHRQLPGLDATATSPAVLAWELDDGLPPATTERMIVAVGTSEGFVLLSNDVGGWNAGDNGLNGGTGLTGTPAARLENGMFRIEFVVTESADETDDYAWEGHDDVSCYSETIEPTTETSHVTLCSLSEPITCSDFIAGPARVTTVGSSHIACFDPDEGEVEGPDDDAPPPGEPTLATGSTLTSVSAIDATHVHLVDGTGAHDLPWSEAAQQGAPLVPAPQPDEERWDDGE